MKNLLKNRSTLESITFLISEAETAGEPVPLQACEAQRRSVSTKEFASSVEAA
jgi:hypothetical protein